MHALILAVALSCTGQAGDWSECRSACAAMNAERTRYGLAPLRPSPALAAIADRQAADCARRGRLSHTGSDGSNPWSRASRAGYPGRSVGENAAWNYADGSSVVSGWMRSPGHRAAVLGRSFTEVGVAVERGPRGPYWISVFGGP